MAIAWDESKNRITASGFTVDSPCAFQDLYDFDIAGSDARTLLDGTIDADPDTFSLDKGPFPANDLAVPLKISCTARGGATCDISGTDAWGNAITENGIDISSGSATTTERFATIDAGGITVNGLQNGDNFDVTQDRYGVVWQIDPHTFILDCILQNGSNSYFTDIAKAVSFSADCNPTNYNTLWYNNGVITLGQVISETYRSTENGCHIFVDNDAISGGNIHLFSLHGDTYLYGCYIKSERYRLRINSRYGRLWHVILDKVCWTRCLSPGGEGYDVLLVRGYQPILYPFDGTLESIKVYTPGNLTQPISLHTSYAFVIKDLTMAAASRAAGIYQLAIDNYYINCTLSNWTLSWGATDYGGGLQRQYEFDLKVIDSDGNAISGVTVEIANALADNGAVHANLTATAASGQKVVTLDDTSLLSPGDGITLGLYTGAEETKTIDTVDSGTQITLTANLDNTHYFGYNVQIVDGNLMTDANGDIKTQRLTYIRYSQPSDVTYSPITVTMSKSGYESRVVPYEMDRQREEIEMLTQTAPVTDEFIKIVSIEIDDSAE